MLNKYKTNRAATGILAVVVITFLMLLSGLVLFKSSQNKIHRSHMTAQEKQTELKKSYELDIARNILLSRLEVLSSDVNLTQTDFQNEMIGIKLAFESRADTQGNIVLNCLECRMNPDFEFPLIIEMEHRIWMPEREVYQFSRQRLAVIEGTFSDYSMVITGQSEPFTLGAQTHAGMVSIQFDEQGLRQSLEQQGFGTIPLDESIPEDIDVVRFNATSDESIIFEKEANFFGISEQNTANTNSYYGPNFEEGVSFQNEGPRVGSNLMADMSQLAMDADPELQITAEPTMDGLTFLNKLRYSGEKDEREIQAMMGELSSEELKQIRVGTSETILEYPDDDSCQVRIFNRNQTLRNGRLEITEDEKFNGTLIDGSEIIRVQSNQFRIQSTSGREARVCSNSTIISDGPNPNIYLDTSIVKANNHSDVSLALMTAGDFHISSQTRNKIDGRTLGEVYSAGGLLDSSGQESLRFETSFFASQGSIVVAPELLDYQDSPEDRRLLGNLSFLGTQLLKETFSFRRDYSSNDIVVGSFGFDQKVQVFDESQLTNRNRALNLGTEESDLRMVVLSNQSFEGTNPMRARLRLEETLRYRDEGQALVDFGMQNLFRGPPRTN